MLISGHVDEDSRRQPASAPSFQPSCVPSTQSPAELTLKAVVIGALFGLLFGASTVYLGCGDSPSAPRSRSPCSRFRSSSGSVDRRSSKTTSSRRSGRRANRSRAASCSPSRADLPHAKRSRVLQLLPDHGADLRRRHPRRVDDGAAAAGVDREGARRPALSRRTACAEVLVAGERGGKLATLVFSGLGVGALWKALSWVFNIFRTEVGHTAPRTSQFPMRR